MTCAIIIRHHDGVQSYLVLDDNPRELLCHVGFNEPFSVRPWLGSRTPSPPGRMGGNAGGGPGKLPDCRRRPSGLLPGTLFLGPLRNVAEAPITGTGRGVGTRIFAPQLQNPHTLSQDSSIGLT